MEITEIELEEARKKLNNHFIIYGALMGSRITFQSILENCDVSIVHRIFIKDMLERIKEAEKINKL